MPIVGGPEKKAHVGHDKHLCNILMKDVDIEEYKKLVKNPNYVCRGCGRTAVKAENLCDPVPL